MGYAKPAPETIFQVELPEKVKPCASSSVYTSEVAIFDSEKPPGSEAGEASLSGSSFRDALLELPVSEGVKTRVKEPEPLPSLSEIDLSHLDKDSQRRLRRMLSAYAEMWDGKLGEIQDAKHHVTRRKDAKPFRINPYRTDPSGRAEIRKAITAMKEDGVIRDAKSEWASPVVLIPKPDGSMQFCLDYRRLNEITVKDSYPLPRMEDCLDSLGEAKYFTTLDCNSGYWQIPVLEEERSKTAFTCHEGCFEFCRIPFGLCNAPATFQRKVDMMLSGYRWRTCLVYLDDIIVFSNTKEDHFTHVRENLTILKEAGFSMKLRKCNFFAQSVDYLGHAIRPGKIEVASKNTEAVQGFKEPRTQTELRSCNVYRRFVPNFGRTPAALNALLRKGCLVEVPPFTIEQTEAFELLKKALIKPPVLRLPKSDLPYSVDTDACNHQVGCALL